jgi:hypothetical protein
LPDRRRDRSGDRTLDQRGVREQGVRSVHLAAVQRRLDAQDRAAEVGENEYAAAAVGLADRAGDDVATRSERAVRSAAGRDDAHVSTRDLIGHVGQSLGQSRRMRHQYNPDHKRLGMAGILHCRTAFGNYRR